MNKINIEDFKEDNNSNIRKKLLKKCVELIQTVLSEKNINMEEYSYIEDEYERYKHIFYYDVYLCSDVYYLLNSLLEKNKTVSKDNIDDWIYQYNNLIDELNNYFKVKQEVEEQGKEEVNKKLDDYLKKLCIEMLKYKNKPIDINMSVPKLLSKIEQYYHYNIVEISYLRSAYNGYGQGANIDVDPKILNTIERIMEVRGLSFYLESNYKENAFLYKDFELKEGQTFTDLYREYLDRNYTLYKEMLDFLKVEYDKTKPPIFQIELVKKYYPFYIDYIDDKNKPYFDPYASLLTRMDEYYELISKNYKKDFIDEINKYAKYIRSHKNCSKKEMIKELKMTEEEIDKIEELIHEDVVIENKDYSFEMTDEIIELIKNNINQLNSREKEILDYHYGIFSNKKHTIEETSNKFDLSTIRIKQIEAKVIRDLQRKKRI